MIGIIAGVIEGIAEAWEAIKGFLRLSKVVTWARKLRKLVDKYGIIMCALKWYFYIRQLTFLFSWLTSLGIEASVAAKWLGLTRLIGITNSGEKEKIMRALAHNREQLEEQLDIARELDLRRRLPPSPLNGSHRPPYASSTILEVLFDYDNLVGSGTMIIIFNPEGFGAKPRSPQIVRFVSEQEFNDFTKGSPSSTRANSWGMFWRNNYLLRLGGKGSNRAKTGRHKNYEVDTKGNSLKDIKESDNQFNIYDISPSTIQHIEHKEVDWETGNEKTSAKVENLDDYMERVLELPDSASDIISENLNEMINTAAEKHQNSVEVMTDAIENSKWGHAIEEDGIRITSAVSDKVRAIPKNLQRIVSGNPVFRDITKVTSRYKKSLGRWRYLRDVWNTRKITTELDATVLALSGAMGQGLAAEAALLSSTNGVTNLLSGEITEAVRQAETTGKSLAETSASIRDKSAEANSINEEFKTLNAEKKAIEERWEGVDIEGAGYHLDNGDWYNPAMNDWSDDWQRLEAIGTDIEERGAALQGALDGLSAAQKEVILKIPKEFTKGLIAPPTCKMA